MQQHAAAISGTQHWSREGPRATKRGKRGGKKFRSGLKNNVEVRRWKQAREVRKEKLRAQLDNDLAQLRMTLQRSRDEAREAALDSAEEWPRRALLSPVLN